MELPADFLSLGRGSVKDSLRTRRFLVLLSVVVTPRMP